MREYVTEALVLAKEPLRDLDGRYFFFTKRYGKVVGKATSSRKITSKLAGHLEPGSFVRVRFVERNGSGGNGNGAAQIADALKYGRTAALAGDLAIVSRLLADNEPDAALWNALAADRAVTAQAASSGMPGNGRFSWPLILALLGWDPRHAACETCGGAAEAFFIPRQEFFCARCASKLPRDEVLLLMQHAEI